MRFLRVALLLVLVLAVSGCGAEKRTGSIPAGAEFAPASAPVYIAFVTDPNGDQWQAAERLLDRFPGRDKFLASARKDLEKDGLDWERDLKPALPVEVHVVWVDFKNNGNNVVGYAKPKNEAKFNNVLEAGDNKLAHRKIEGWTVFAESEAQLDRFVSARSSAESLSGNESFRDAMEGLPDDGAARGWVSGEAIQAEIDREAGTNADAQAFKDFSKTFGTIEYASFSANAEDEGVKVEAAYKTKGGPKFGNYSPELDDALPSGALLYVSFGNLEDFFNSLLVSADENFPEFKTQRTEIEQALGFSLKDDLFPLFSREGAVAVYRGGELVPNVLFALRVPDEKDAQRVVDRFAALASVGGETSRKSKVDGVDVTEIVIADLGFSIFAAVTDGKAFATNSKAALEQALGDAEKLAGDAVYQEARTASGTPDDTAGFFYLNLKAGLPYVFEFAEMSAPGSITPDVRQNTKPLESALLYARQDGDRTSVSGFLTIK